MHVNDNIDNRSWAAYGIDCGLVNCFGLLKKLSCNISIKECDNLNFEFKKMLNLHYLFGNILDTIADLMTCESLI